MNDLDKAIKVLRQEYERALKMDFIKNPIAYALYRTWRNFDKKGR